jgi:hypothetical protein
MKGMAEAASAKREATLTTSDWEEKNCTRIALVRL